MFGLCLPQAYGEAMHRIVADALDSLPPRELPMGYIAEYHSLIRGLLTVWAPCGCVLAISSMASFVMPCSKPSCDFSWENANAALKLLQDAQVQVPTGDAPRALSKGPSGHEPNHPSAPLRLRPRGLLPETCQSLSEGLDESIEEPET